MPHKYINNLVSRYPELSDVTKEIENAIDVLQRCYKGGSTIYTCGNGGSAADADHIVGELMKGFALKREISTSEKKIFSNLYPDTAADMCANLQQGIPAVSLVSNSALMTAILNDLDPKYLFAQQIYSIGRTGDVLIAISTSGNSVNVINAAKVALAKGLKVITLTGQDNGILGQYSSVNINAPSVNVAHIQEYHLPIYHCMCLVLEDLSFGVGSFN